MAKHWIWGCLAAGAMTVGALAADFRLPPADGVAPAIPAPPPPADLETLDLARTVEMDADAAAALTPEDWSLDALAATFGGDATAAYDWVKTKTRFEPYAGALRTPTGTLAARAGNSADRARLLAALLTRMGVKIRFARGTLDDDMAGAMVDGVFVPTSISTAAPRSELLDATAARAQHDYALLRPLVSAEADAAGDATLIAARKAAADHVWVEAEIGGAWTALDPDAAHGGETIASAAETFDEIPEALFQTVTFRISAVSVADGQVATTEALNARIPAAKLAGAAVFLAFVENPKEGGIGGAINKAMTGGGSYVPVLYVDGEPFVGEAVPGLGKPSGGGALDLLGGGDESAPQTELARLELSLETAGPDGVTGSAVRTLLDRAPGAAVVAPDTALAAMPMAEGLPVVTAALHNIQITTGPVNMRDAYALRALAITEIVMTYSDPEKAKGLGPADLIWPIAAINATLPMALENAIVPALNDASDVRVFTGAPRVTILTTGAIDGPDGTPYRVNEIDLKLSGLTVLAREGAARAAFERRLWAGILESATETEFGLRAGQLLFMPETTVRISASRASDAALVRHDTSEPGFGADAPRTARAAVERGALVFAPEGVLTAWWEIDPATGAARAVLAPDLGGMRSYGGYRPEPSRTLDSSWGRQRTGLNSGRGGVVHMTEDGSRSIIQGQRNLGGAGRGGPPPNRCSGGNEYMTILGCVSLPAGWALREFYALLIFDVVITATDIIMLMVLPR